MARTKQTARSQSIGVRHTPVKALPPPLDNIPITVQFPNDVVITFDDAKRLYDSCFSLEIEIDDVVAENDGKLPSPLTISMVNAAEEGRPLCTPHQLKSYLQWITPESINTIWRDHLVAAWCLDDEPCLNDLDEVLRDNPFIPRDIAISIQQHDEELWDHVRDIIKATHPRILIAVDDATIRIKNPCISDMGNSKLLMEKLEDDNTLDLVTITGVAADAVRAWAYYRRDKVYEAVPYLWILVTQGAVAMRDTDFMDNQLPSLLCKLPEPVEFSDEEKQQLQLLPADILQNIMRHTVLRAPKKKQATKSIFNIDGHQYDDVVDGIVVYGEEPDCIVVLGNTAFRCMQRVIGSNVVFVQKYPMDADMANHRTRVYTINPPHGIITNPQMQKYLQYIHEAANGDSLGNLLSDWQDVFAAAWGAHDEAFMKNIFPDFVTRQLYSARNHTTGQVMGVPNVVDALATHTPLQKLAQDAYTYDFDTCMLLCPLKRKAEQLTETVQGLRKARKDGDGVVIAAYLNQLEKSIVGDEVA